MAQFETVFQSEMLCRAVRVQVLIPNDVFPEMKQGNPHYERPLKTLFLLHGYSGCDKDWLIGSDIATLSAKYNVAVVMPNGENSFYLNGAGTGRAYASFVGEELPEYMKKTFQICNSKEDTYIGGLSMGGFGALHTGLAYPNTFGKIAALSSALIVHNIAHMQPGDLCDVVADYDYYRLAFGDLEVVEQSDNNPEVLLKKIKEYNEAVPPIYIACGTEDFLLEHNRAFKSFLDSEQIPVHYIEGTGTHDWKYWNHHLALFLPWMLES